MTARTNRTQKIDLRITPQHKEALTKAAALSRRSLSDFVLQSALDKADETLADRRNFVLDEASWDAFVKALDAPPEKNRALQRLLAKPDIFSGT